MAKHPIERVAPDSPDRCLGSTAHGQCNFKKVEGFDFCMMHGGKFADVKKAAVRNYQIEKYRAKLEHFNTSPEIKSLREEIGILRLLVQEKLQLCNSEIDLVLASQPISDLVVKINALVTSAHKLEVASSVLMDRNQAMQMADEIILILSEHIPMETLAIVSDKIIDCIAGE